MITAEINTKDSINIFFVTTFLLLPHLKSNSVKQEQVITVRIPEGNRIQPPDGSFKISGGSLHKCRQG